MKDSLFTFTDEERNLLAQQNRAHEELLSPYATRDSAAIREHADTVDPDDALIRGEFMRDVDRILNNAFYNRCSDKTQVFPLYRNDDLTRRAFHLQLVAHISEKLARALGLNVDLTRAIGLGHDMGHTPFGHAGERYLSDLYHEHTGRYFNHNVHSVRILRTVAGCNLSLQTFNGILCHCGEKAFDRYEPAPCDSFDQLEAMMETCYTTPGASQTFRPSTLEGCVVRICDMLAYLGKDRQDALSVGVLSPEEYRVQDCVLGATNGDFIGNALANIVKNSLGKPYLSMSPEVFEAIVQLKSLNAQQIYQSDEAHETLDEYVYPMMEAIYERCLEDLARGDENSWIWRHHMNLWVLKFNKSYADERPDDIVMDYIASMTDDYFIDLYNVMFPEDAKDKQKMYVPYFRN